MPSAAKSGFRSDKVCVNNRAWSLDCGHQKTLVWLKTAIFSAACHYIFRIFRDKAFAHLPFSEPKSHLMGIQKVDKKSKPTQKWKHTNSIPEYFEYFCQMSLKSIPIILSYTVSNLVHFLGDSVHILVTTGRWSWGGCPTATGDDDDDYYYY